MRICRLPIAAALMLFSLPAMAGEVTVTSAWTRAMLPGAKVAAGFAIIRNSGRGGDRLVAAVSPAAARAEIHSMSMNDGVMVMRPEPEGVAIPENGALELKPGGLHLMLVGVAEPFEEGGTVPVTLTFEKAGEVTIEFAVLSPGAKEFGGAE